MVGLIAKNFPPIGGAHRSSSLHTESYSLIPEESPLVPIASFSSRAISPQDAFLGTIAMDSRSTTTLADDDDPVIASFDVLLKPPLPADQSLYVLQYPNRATDNPAHLRNPDIEKLRVKPKTGMIEVDVPINYDAHYDKKKGVTWGSALRKTMDAKEGMGSLGLAGGFGINSAPGRRPGRPGAAASAPEGSDQIAWAEALRTSNVLSTQTLGGLGEMIVTHGTWLQCFKGVSSVPSMPPRAWRSNQRSRQSPSHPGRQLHPPAPGAASPRRKHRA